MPTTALPALLFGLRLWASVCLAYYLAFWLELDHAIWAGLSAAIVCQPHLGASLRKGWFRTIGTLVGAVFSVALVAVFPQQRGPFLLGLALWGGACALFATVLPNFGSYAAALAGYTAAIIAADELGATGGPDGQVFMLAITRVSEICIGIASASLVLAGTDLGNAQRRLAELLATLSSEAAQARFGALGDGNELSRRVIRAEALVDEGIGESIRLRRHSEVLHAALRGLLTALAGWRTDTVDSSESRAVLACVPPEVRAASEASWLADPIRLRLRCKRAAQALLALPATTPSLRLSADQSARGLESLARALEGLALLVSHRDRERPARVARFELDVADWLPPFLSAGRTFLAIAAVAGFWIVTAWPNGASAITWAAIPALLFAARGSGAYPAATGFMAGNAVALVFAAVVAFGVLPALSTFTGFSLALGLYLVPAGALIVRYGTTPMTTAMAFNFLAPLPTANQMSYDPQSFYNAALSILLGNAAAALAFRVLPPLLPERAASRLLRRALRELRGLAADPIPQTNERWERRILRVIAAVPDGCGARDRASLLAALSTGTEILNLRHAALRLGVGAEVDWALAPFAEGSCAPAAARLHLIDARLANGSAHTSLRARASLLQLREAFARHASYFGGAVA